MELEEWFKLKKYPHIGKPIKIKDYKWVKSYIDDPEKISKHSFLPLIHKSIVKRKFRVDYTEIDRNPSKKRKRIKGKSKVREIFFASHLDSLIFSKYNALLSEEYENYLEDKAFNDSIVAYRKILIEEESEKHKCNIDHAKKSFEFIHKHKDSKLSVIVADVTSFFDNLDHQILKRQWRIVLKDTTLPKEHYNLYKALTNIKYIESEQLFESYNKTMLVECGVPNTPSKRIIKRKSIHSSRYFKENNAVAYCYKSEFLKNNLNLIKSKNNNAGIPQGTPISATLANIYMLEFDYNVFEMVSTINGFYQRYSDDLIIVCEQKYEDDVIDLIRSEINKQGLNIEPQKTKVYRFEEVEGKFSGFEINEFTKLPNYNKNLEYLGFSFNGQKVLIKTSGFSKFYRSMKSSFKKSTSFALNSKNPDKTLFKSRLYKRFTHRGAKRKLIYRPSKADNTKYEKSKEYYWGNYLSYIYKANDCMKSINGDNSILKQSRKFWNKFHVLMKFHEKKLLVKNEADKKYKD